MFNIKVYNSSEVITMMYVLVFMDKRYLLEVNAFKPETSKDPLMIMFKYSSDNTPLVWLDKVGCEFVHIPFTHKALKDYINKNVIGTEWLARDLSRLDEF